MKRTMLRFPNGGKIWYTDDGVKVFATDGSCSRFDNEGKLIQYSVLEKPEWLKYFFLMDESKRAKVATWLKTIESAPVTKKQHRFLNIVSDAVHTVHYDYWVATIEPAKTHGSEGKLYFKPGERVPVDVGNLAEWETLCREFAPECDSDIANIKELFLWYAYRIANGNWTLEYICDGIGPMLGRVDNVAHLAGIDYTGQCTFGGFNDGVYNTYKVVRFGKDFVLTGHKSIAEGTLMDEYACDIFPHGVSGVGSGVVVLRGTWMNNK